MKKQIEMADVKHNEVFDTREAAVFLRMSKQTLELHRMKGTGPLYVRMARMIRYMREDLLQWLRDQGKQTSTSQNPEPPKFNGGEGKAGRPKKQSA